MLLPDIWSRKGTFGHCPCPSASGGRDKRLPAPDARETVRTEETGGGGNYANWRHEVTKSDQPSSVRPGHKRAVHGIARVPPGIDARARMTDVQQLAGDSTGQRRRTGPLVLGVVLALAVCGVIALLSLAAELDRA